MKRKSFHINGLLVEVHPEQLPDNKLRLTVYLDGKKIKESAMVVPEADFDKTVRDLEQMLKENMLH